ncbi:MAG: four-carbon acid sugar kinase family protein [Treponema sp.]|jgi:uncharacterized protein YgbK (DUF1537 family)|nr:four-carbon acid sugar kinase family protein [Treponema sp.]
MNHYLIIADDFTGANDTGVQIRRRGIPVRVVFSGRGVTGKESCVVDTESRGLSEEEAYRKTASEAGNIPFGDFVQVMKKVDSTLRGNIGAETRAVADRYNPELIVFAPALPDLGRTTVNRIHRLYGTPITLTEPAGDPKTPVKIDDIRQILSHAFPGETAAHIDLEAVRGGRIGLKGGRIFCFDAAANSDLQAIVRAVLAEGKRVLWVGAAALADSLLELERAVPPALAVLASLSSVTRGQALYAEKQGVSLVKAPLDGILEKRVNPEETADRAAGLLKEGKDVVLLASSTYSGEEYRKAEDSARRSGLSAEAMSAFTQDLMGKLALRLLDGVKISGLFLSGGDTAVGCFEKAGALGSSIMTEIAAGIPMMRLIGGKHEGLKVATKAGAFGKEDAVFYALRKLREADDLC